MDDGGDSEAAETAAMDRISHMLQQIAHQIGMGGASGGDQNDRPDPGFDDELVPDDDRTTEVTRWRIVVHDDDWHTYETVQKAFREIGLSRGQADIATRKVDNNGDVTVFHTMANELLLSKHANTLATKFHLIVSVESPETANGVRVAETLCEWLLSLANHGEGLLELLVRALAKEPTAGGSQAGPKAKHSASNKCALEQLMLIDPYLTLSMRNSLHSLFTLGFRRDTFRNAFIEAYSNAAPKLLRSWAAGVGTSKSSILMLGVQVLTSPSLVRQFALPTSSASASSGSSSSAADPEPTSKKGLLVGMCEAVREALVIATHTILHEPFYPKTANICPSIAVGELGLQTLGIGVPSGSFPVHNSPPIESDKMTEGEYEI